MSQPQRTLLITRQDLLIDVVSVYLEGWFQSRVEVADSSLKLEQALASPDGFALAIVEEEKLLQAAGKVLADLMAPTIVIGREPKDKPLSGRKIVYLQSPIELEKLSSAIQSFALSSGGAYRAFCAVRPQILVMSGKELMQDIYAERDGDYELVFPKGKRLDFDEELLARMGKKKHLFMRSEDFSRFMSSFAEEMQELSGKGAEVFDLGKSVGLAIGMHEILADALPELGFTPELQKATKASIDLVVGSLRKDPRLKSLLEALLQNEGSYQAWHSTTLCYIACRLSSLMTWDSANTHYKLSFAAFLHDITLKSEKLHRVRTLDELDNMPASQVSDQEKDEFREHAHAAAAISRGMKDFPGDVDHIIAQHHELPSGDGFPLGVNHTKISPLAAVFIVAHDLTEELFDKRGALKLKESVARLERIYTQGYFKRVIQALKELCMEDEAAGL
jgi:HD-GYP domain-containing protein (c-di-GMP phosphodiesterase class II)